MKKLFSVLLSAAVAFALAVACSQSGDSRRLQHAAEIAETDPEAALAICDSIGDPMALSASDQALYGFVSSLSADILGEPVPDPDLLDYAIGYYSSFWHRDNLKRAICMFVKAHNLITDCRYAEAAELTSDALLVLGSAGNDPWRGRFYRQMADISINFLNFGNVWEYTDSAINIFDRAGMDAHAQYERLRYAICTSDEGDGADAIRYLDSVFPPGTHFLAENEYVYNSTKASAYTRIGKGEEALQCLAQISEPDYTAPPHMLIQTYIVATAQAGQFDLCDSLLEVYRRSYSGDIPMDEDLNYCVTMFEVEKFKGNYLESLKNLEQWVALADSIHTAASVANIQWYESRLAVENVRVEGRRHLLSAVIVIAFTVILALVVIIILMRINGRRKNLNLKCIAEIAILRDALHEMEDAAVGDSATAASIEALNAIIRESDANGGSIKPHKLNAMISELFQGNVYFAIEEKVEAGCPGLIHSLREAGVSADDIRMLVLAKWGLQAAAISVIMNIEAANVKVRRSRAKTKIGKLPPEESSRIIAYLWPVKRNNKE